MLDSGGPLHITDVHVRIGGDDDHRPINPGEALALEVSYRTDRTLRHPVLNVSIVSTSGQTMFETDFDLTAEGVGSLDGEGTVRVEFSRVPLLDGRYAVSTRLTDRDDAELAAVRYGRDEFSVLNPGVAQGVVSLEVGSVKRC